MWSARQSSTLRNLLRKNDKVNLKLEEIRGGLVVSLDLLVKGVTIWSYIHQHCLCIRGCFTRGLIHGTKSV